ncbi:hypothetical protein M513_12753 [Trichuris suis]|uniref:Uncharacterized protein n=1 Tax=Trichuris suis TaxID=68888 RepID=A0A085LN36_9BILA|nr:hypothetical protein M513_12753 [Trichuris suis]
MDEEDLREDNRWVRLTGTRIFMRHQEQRVKAVTGEHHEKTVKMKLHVLRMIRSFDVWKLP